tara:strand:+ start:196 stop:549 length:354 start_codon:yes stop_codon:yes gene_type:complete
MRAIILFIALLLLSTFLTLYTNQASAGGPWNNQYCDVEITIVKIVDQDGEVIDTKTEEKLTCDDGAKDFLHGMGIADTCEIFTWHIFLGGQMVEQRSIACEKMDGSYEIVKGYHNLN